MLSVAVLAQAFRRVPPAAGNPRCLSCTAAGGLRVPAQGRPPRCCFSGTATVPWRGAAAAGGAGTAGSTLAFLILRALDQGWRLAPPSPAPPVVHHEREVVGCASGPAGAAACPVCEPCPACVVDPGVLGALREALRRLAAADDSVLVALLAAAVGWVSRVLPRLLGAPLRHPSLERLAGYRRA